MCVCVCVCVCERERERERESPRVTMMSVYTHNSRIICQHELPVWRKVLLSPPPPIEGPLSLSGPPLGMMASTAR